MRQSVYKNRHLSKLSATCKAKVCMRHHVDISE